MLPAVKFNIINRGSTPRRIQKVMTAATKESWFETGLYFHKEMSDERFTHRHATLAGYQKRTANYERRKLRKFGHTNPLEFSGRTRRLARTANITSTRNGASVRYGGLNTLNFRNPKAKNPINMADEFRRVTQPEADDLARHFDRELDKRLNANQATD